VQTALPLNDFDRTRARSLLRKAQLPQEWRMRLSNMLFTGFKAEL
jgi:hypothetical protein